MRGEVSAQGKRVLDCRGPVRPKAAPIARFHVFAQITSKAFRAVVFTVITRCSPKCFL